MCDISSDPSMHDLSAVEVPIDQVRPGDRFPGEDETLTVMSMPTLGLYGQIVMDVQGDCDWRPHLVGFNPRKRVVVYR